MANDDAPRGFWPIRHLTGGTIRTTEHTIASGYGTGIFQGDIVKLVAGGGIEASAAGNRSLGVFAGVSYVDSEGNQVYKKYWPASTTATSIKAYVYDDPNIVFGVQSAGSTVAADVGNLGDHVAGTGSTTTGRSAHELNGSTGTAYAGFRVLGKVDTPNNAYGTNVDLEVQLVEHEYMPGNEATTPGV
tara:strand:- start:1372 stop:1935 length:564 start_codon:yes stop_codon:yes gene_type:complete